MFWRRQVAARLMMVLGIALLPVSSAAGAARIMLLPEASVSTDAILLSDLLTDDAPASVRAAAEQIFLASAPQQGAARRFRGADIADAISRSGLTVSRFDIPDEISVARDGRALNGDELLAAIRKAASAFPLSPVAEAAVLTMHAADLNWDSEIRVAPGPARLSVEQIYVEPASGQASFRMSVPSEAHGLPFDVQASLFAKPRAGALQPTTSGAAANRGVSVTSNERAGAPRLSGGSRSAASGVDSAGEPALIKAGHTARLHLHSENSDILVDVLALDAGHAGETIRVRMPLGGSTLRARVTGPGELDATF